MADSSEDVGFKIDEAKQQQKRESIIGELYNDMSSSSDEEDDNDSSAKPTATAAAVAKSSANEKRGVAAKESAQAASSDKVEETAVSNPFKRQATAAQTSEALKELYGDDYEEPIGLDAMDPE